MTSLKQKRLSVGLIQALRAIIEAGTPKERDKLAQAFQDWAGAQSAYSYGRLQKHGLLGDIIEAINQASGAGIIVEQGLILIDDSGAVR